MLKTIIAYKYAKPLNKARPAELHLCLAELDANERHLLNKK